MNLTINTKFNIGDEVYCLTCYDGVHSAINCAYEVMGIEICIKPEPTVYYNVYMKDISMMGSYAEDRLFTTYEECVQWCNKHNCN